MTQLLKIEFKQPAGQSHFEKFMTALTSAIQQREQTKPATLKDILFTPKNINGI